MSPCKKIRCQPHQTRVNSWVSSIVTPALTQLCVCLSHKTSFASQLQCQCYHRDSTGGRWRGYHRDSTGGEGSNSSSSSSTNGRSTSTSYPRDLLSAGFYGVRGGGCHPRNTTRDAGGAVGRGGCMQARRGVHASAAAAAAAAAVASAAAAAAVAAAPMAEAPAPAIPGICYLQDSTG